MTLFTSCYKPGWAGREVGDVFGHQRHTGRLGKLNFSFKHPGDLSDLFGTICTNPWFKFVNKNQVLRQSVSDKNMICLEFVWFTFVQVLRQAVSDSLDTFASFVNSACESDLDGEVMSPSLSNIASGILQLLFFSTIT